MNDLVKVEEERGPNVCRTVVVSKPSCQCCAAKNPGEKLHPSRVLRLRLWMQWLLWLRPHDHNPTELQETEGLCLTVVNGFIISRYCLALFSSRKSGFIFGP